MRRLALLAVLLFAIPAVARAATDTEGRSTVQQTIVGSNGPGFDAVGLGPGQAYVTRADVGAVAQPARNARRRSLLYFGQLTDFQLADEESPSKVEFLDVPGPTSAAWRPQEALGPFAIDFAIRQMNSFVPASPLTDGQGRRARMRFALTTGDSADNQERNETEWVVTLLEGHRTLDPNSGVEGGCPGVPAGESARYTGVQDYDDYPPGNTQFYDPDDPKGPWAVWPKYTGLMDRAQQPFTPAGLDVPSYVAFGNHDGLAQGNQKAQEGFEAIGTGCIKPTAGTGLGSPPTSVMNVPRDDRRSYVDKAQYKALHATGHQADAHGFAYVDPAERAASNGAAGYYAWDPAPGFRFIGIDTVSEGGVTGPSSEGNIDDPQFRWLERELRAASAADKLIVLFGHHPVRSLTANVSDETPPPCSSPDAHGHDRNPGCDVDPRNSQPIHLGPDLVNLVNRFPHVLAYVAGHTHENKVTPFQRPGGGWWGIETASEADWPQQNRLIELFDNLDGTLSIFGTPLDQAGPTAIPPSGSATAFSAEQLAGISRTFAFNDPQAGGGSGEGTPADRAVELLVRNPRRTAGGSACRDRFPPRTTLRRSGLRLSRRLARVTGAARDVDCAPFAGPGSAGKGRVSKVYVAVGRRVRGGCRFLTARGGLTRRRSCRRQIFQRARVRYLPAVKRSTWLLRKRVRLPRGTYFSLARARDPRGNLERIPGRRSLVFRRVR